MQEDFDGTPTQIKTSPIGQNEIYLTAIDYTMTPGKHYFFHYYFTNGQGDSPASDIMEIALGDYPAAPNAPTKNDLLSTVSSIYLEWGHVSETQLSVVGYELWMDAGSNGYFQKVFDGRNQPGIV